jgi:hypothetical protein
VPAGVVDRTPFAGGQRRLDGHNQVVGRIRAVGSLEQAAAQLIQDHDTAARGCHTGQVVPAVRQQLRFREQIEDTQARLAQVENARWQLLNTTEEVFERRGGQARTGQGAHSCSGGGQPAEHPLAGLYHRRSLVRRAKGAHGDSAFIARQAADGLGSGAGLAGGSTVVMTPFPWRAGNVPAARRSIGITQSG